MQSTTMDHVAPIGGRLNGTALRSRLAEIVDAGVYAHDLSIDLRTITFGTYRSEAVGRHLNNGMFDAEL
ncbi:MAG: hypothetical protein CMJ17_04670 [Phenylobacterium sp.]|nr:hypothetical protein [Phenylobacterium sp.]